MTFRAALLALAVCFAASVSSFAQTCTSVTLSPAAASHGSASSTGIFTASGTPTNCQKSAASNVSWITLSTIGGTANPATISYTVQSNNSTAQRTGTITLNGGLATYTVIQSGISCTYSFSPSSASVASTGGSGSVSVSTQSPCAWTPTSSASWIQVSGGATGNGDFNYSVEPNTSTASRTGTISVGSTNFTITQQPACSFTLSPSFQQIRSSGDTGTVTITANLSSCTRTAISDAAWLTIPVGSTGTGSGTLSWTATANNQGAQRTGRITVGDATFTVQQEGAACTSSIAPSTQSLPAAGGTGSFTLTTNCAWQAASTAPWLSITSSTTGSGNATITFSAPPNLSPQSRSASITVGTTAFTVTQEGTPCQLTISASALDVTATGGPGEFNVVTQGGCNWTAVTNVSWIIFTSPAAGSGDATVTFSVAPNTTPGARTGVITVGPRTYTVTQAGANCELSINPTSASLPSNAFQGTIAVTSTCQWTASPTVGWISILAGAAGNGNGQIDYSVGANPSASARTGAIRIGNLTFNISQSGGGCSITLNPTSGTFAGGAVNGRFNVNGSAGCQWTPQSADPWITVSAFSSVNGSGSVDFSLAPNLTGSPRSGAIRVNNETYAVTQSPARPAIAANGILNAASFRTGPVAPGQIVTIYGTLAGPADLKTLDLNADRSGITNSLAGTRVLFNDIPAPMIFTSERQVAAVAPYSIGTLQSVDVRLEYQGATSDPVTVPVAGAVPAIFTQAASGTGPGAILNQDNSLNTAANAALRNTIIQIFANGGGQTTPPSADGRFAPSNPLAAYPAGRVTVRIGTLDAPVVYAGGAPGLINGLIQINARVPANATVGAAVPIFVRIGNVDSPAGVTVAVR
jgi:uncharacterized protein (TIGR03437 family)